MQPLPPEQRMRRQIMRVTDVPATGSSGTASPASSHPESADIGGFFADMGDFLLTVWPYLLIAAVLSAIITGIIKLRKKQ